MQIMINAPLADDTGLSMLSTISQSKLSIIKFVWFQLSKRLLNNNAKGITDPSKLNQQSSNFCYWGICALATLGSYYQSQLLTAAVVAGFVVGSGYFLLLL